MRTTIFSVLLLMSLTACNNDTNQYDSGYEAAWNGEKEPSSIWSTKKQRNGYQDGLDDADMYMVISTMIAEDEKSWLNTSRYL